MTIPHTHRLGLDRPEAHDTSVVSAGDAGRLPSDGRVSVSRCGWQWRGHCTCQRWTSRRRLLRSVAVLDALTHAARCGCEPAVPLVDHSAGWRYRGARS